MNWFFYKLHEIIAQNKESKPAKNHEIKLYCIHDLDIGSIMVAVNDRIRSLFGYKSDLIQPFI
jgi:hypothetical protein